MMFHVKRNRVDAEGGARGGEALLRITLTKIWVGIVGLMYCGWFVCVMVEALSYGTVG